MDNPLVIQPSEFIYAVPIANLRKAVEKLREKSHVFNHLSVTNSTEGMVSAEIASQLNILGKRIASYGVWKESGMKLAEDPNNVQEVAKEMFDSAVGLNENNVVTGSVDARSLLDLDLIDGDICNKIASLWFTIHCTASFKQDIPMRVYSRVLSRIVNDLVIVLNEALNVFEHCWKIPEIQMFSLKLPIESENKLKFEWHEEAVSFSQEELDYMRKQEEERREAERLEQEKKKTIAETEQLSKDILDSYNKVFSAGAIPNFKFREDHLNTIMEPKTVEDCKSVRSLWRFLMAMSDSVRYMPGDRGKPLDRISGSFVEINDNIIRYNTNMLLYLHTSFEMDHDDVVTALKFLNGSGEHTIVAQYVDTKDYIEEYGKGTSVPKTISVFMTK